MCSINRYITHTTLVKESEYYYITVVSSVYTQQLNVCTCSIQYLPRKINLMQRGDALTTILK